MIHKYRIVDLLRSLNPESGIVLQGWIRTRRDSREFSFLELNDGSCLANIQIIADQNIPGYEEIAKMTTGSAVSVTGDLVQSPGKGQKWEVKASSLTLLGDAPEDFPIQKKRHTDEYLRTIAHLRPRSNKYSAMFRLRSQLAHAVHDFFNQRGFYLIHTPIITGADCEGAGNMFHVTTLDLAQVPLVEGRIDYEQDFFGKEANLTVSGQLPLESLCLSLGKVYSFGPTFRAENSNTSRHIAEFWMIEPEVAFADLQDNMQLGQELIRHLIRFVMQNCAEDLELFAKFVDTNLMQRLENIAEQEFPRVSYTEAVSLLKQSGREFSYKPEWGQDLQSEHERFLTEEYFKRPVIVYDYPKQIKAFYMRQNEDAKTVAAMDILVPSIGEIIGGSQREERYEKLESRITELGLSLADYWWYMETRKYGTVPHAGFGMGFERFLMLVTGVTNIRDVIPFPRTPRHLEF